MINYKFHKTNRQKLMAKLPDSLMILSAYRQMQQSNDSAFGFKQESNFWWLTGIEHPDWVLIIDGKKDICTLVAPKISEINRIFNGDMSPEEALLVSGVDQIINIDELDDYLVKSKLVYDKVYTLGYQNHQDKFGFVLNPFQDNLNAILKRSFDKTDDCRSYISKLRAIKQPEEILAIEKAIHISIEAFEKVKQKINKYDYEYQIEAELSYNFRKNGATGHAYEPIVAAGKNACTLHYIHNNSPINDGDMVLIDAGAKIDGYSADITRTYIKGMPTERQKQVHGAVVRVNEQIIDLIRPGLGFEEYIKRVDDIMKQELKSLNLLNEVQDYRKYFPHAISHGLGVDVHDSLDGFSELQPGMILTVEPGIYIPNEGIGARIEDDILVTDDGYKNLTKSLKTAL